MSSVLSERLDVGQIEYFLEKCENEPPSRIFLLSPPVLRKRRTEKTLEVLSRNVPVTSLLYLGAVLEKAGRRVQISEAETFSEMKEEIEEFSPHMVGITATTSQMLQAAKTAELVKKVNPEIIVVGGGPHMSFMYEEVLNESVFDIIVIGAGEKPLLRLTENVPLQKIKGIAFRNNNIVMVNPPEYLNSKELNEFPAPAYHLLKDPHKYKENILLVSSRGCPFNCRMCVCSQMEGRKWIAQNAEAMVSHLKQVLKTFDVQIGLIMRYHDDTFTMKKKRLGEFVELLRENSLQINFKCATRADTFDEETAFYLKEAGCREVFFGIESGNQKFVNFIDKQLNLEDVRRAVEIAHQYGLRVCGSFMIGFPGETEKDIWETIKFAKELRLDRMQLSVLTPFPGTDLYSEAEKKGWLKSRNWEEYDGTYPVMRLENDLDKKLLHLLKRAYISFYLDPRYLVRQLRKGFLIQGGYGKIMLRTLTRYITSL